MLVCSLAFAQTEMSGLNIKHATESAEYDKLKNTYRECVMRKGATFVSVSSVESAIKYAPLACKRELLSIKQFFLSGAFKMNIISQLIESVEQGVEIDLVNLVYAEKLKIQKN
jgi:hypothetical protein